MAKKKDEINTAGAEIDVNSEIGNVGEANVAGKKINTAENDGYVNYCLPFLPGKQPGDSHTVTVNGKNYQVQYGVPVRVPIAVRDILEEMIAQSRHVSRKMQEMKDNDRCIAKFE